MSQVDDLLRLVKSVGGSDLHLTAGRVPRVRINGELATFDDGPALVYAPSGSVLARCRRRAAIF